MHFLLDPAFYHKLLVPRLVGPGLAADVFSGGDKENLLFMGPIGGYTGQLWRFTPTGEGGYLLSTLFRGPAYAASIDAEAADFGAVRLTRDRTRAQPWGVEPIEGPESFAVLPGNDAPFARAGYVRLTTRIRDEDWSLDLSVGGEAFMPTLAARGSGPGQAWLLARTEARVA